MQLPVVSLGYLAKHRLAQSLKVHSRFQHAVNLMADDGHLLTLLDASRYPNLPDAVRVQLPHGWDWRHMTSGISGLENALIWQPEITPAHSTQRPQHYAILVDELSREPVESELMLLPGGDSTKRQPQICAKDCAQMLTYQVSQLVGFGRGLTPDGDDYLLGYLAALWRWQNAPHIAGHVQLMQQIVASQLTRTNDISAHYLRRALHGHFSEPLCNLLILLTTPASNEQIRSTAQNVMQCGASSGTDCLAGLLHGIRTLQTTL
jgi:hypothetical protein